MRDYEWATVSCEGASYDVCICMTFDYVDEVRPVDSEINIIALISQSNIMWMYEKAMEEINANLNAPHFKDMSRMEYLIDEGIEGPVMNDQVA
ncbi:MAG: hypothetical protein EBY22_12155 [Gammaproteobacteria bacterium]|nr:hypothetical protein [Gammaproteobacteria bacterium]